MAELNLCQQKGQLAFNLFDTNRDGFLERSDIDRVIDRVAEVLGHQVGSPEYAMIQSEYSALWDTLIALDTDVDGRLSTEEWLRVFGDLADAAQNQKEVFEAVFSRMFALFDTNSDGKVSAVEFESWLVAHGATESNASTAFRKLDRSGDGEFSRWEVRKAIAEFVSSEEPDAPGNWLFGKF